jgi:CheY-like chemotaxis protein
LAKQHLLLVDGDAESLHVMEVSLRKAGYTVTTAADGREALEKCQLGPPDLVLAEAELRGLDGFELCRRMRADDRLRRTPFILITGRAEERKAGVDLGVDDFVAKPFYIRDVVARVRLLLERREVERIEGREAQASLSGKISELGVADLFQSLERGKKSGALRLRDGRGRTGTIWFDEGAVLDAEVGRVAGEAAFHRLLHWQEGEFEIAFERTGHPARIALPTPKLFAEGLRRLDDWEHVVEQLPPLDRVFQIDYRLLSDRLAEIPDDVNGLLRLVDGRRTLREIIEQSDHDDLAAALILSKLFFEELIRPADPPRAGGAAPRAPGDAAGNTPEPAGVAWFEPHADARPPPPPAGSGAPRIVRFPARPRPAPPPPRDEPTLDAEPVAGTLEPPVEPPAAAALPPVEVPSPVAPLPAPPPPAPAVERSHAGWWIVAIAALLLASAGLAWKVFGARAAPADPPALAAPRDRT